MYSVLPIEGLPPTREHAHAFCFGLPVVVAQPFMPGGVERMSESESKHH